MGNSVDHGNDTGWPFVNREPELDRLHRFARTLITGETTPALLLEAPSGMGKSFLLSEFRTRLADERASLRVAAVHCCSTIGPDLAYGPVVELISQLETQVPRIRRGRTVRSLGDAAPGVIDALLPGAKPFLEAGKEVARATLSSGSMPMDSLWPYQQAYGLRFVDLLLSYATRRRPVLMIVDDLQACDPSSMFVLDRILRRGETHVGIVLAHAPDRGLPSDRGTPAYVQQLLQRWSTEGLLERGTLTELSPSAVDQLVALTAPAAGGATEDRTTLAEIANRLWRVTGGEPIFVAEFLRYGRIRPEGFEYPASWTHLVDEQLSGLDDTDRRLVETAASQGCFFDSVTLAHAVRIDHDVVLERLRALVTAKRFVKPASRKVWAIDDDTSHFRFRHKAVWQVVIDQCEKSQQTVRHQRIATSLQHRLDENATREQRLELARHLHFGGNPTLAESSALHRDLARGAVEDSLSLTEAEQLCDIAIRDARQLRGAGERRDRLLIEAIELQLSLSEVRWRGQHRPAGGPDVDELAAEAEAAAERLQDPEKQIRTTMLRGKTLMATQGLAPGLELLERAVELARGYGDPATLYVARIEYGRQASKRELVEGRRVLEQAHQLLLDNPALHDNTDPVVLHARNLGEIQLGITLFDSGELSAALRELDRSVGRLRRDGHHTELPIALNYLAQVRAGFGDYAAAIEALDEARRLEEERGGDSGWHAYNTALLAHNLLLANPESPNVPRVLDLIEQAWLETERTWLLNLVPIVRNLYAEILLRTADADTQRTAADRLERAERLATATVEETLQSGMVRSQIAAHALLGRIALWRDDARGAAAKADRAMIVLDEVGPMPALRTEEIFYHCAVIFAAVGRGEHARDLLARARAEVERKASLVTDEGMRMRFLDEVALNRAIQIGSGVES